MHVSLSLCTGNVLVRAIIGYSRCKKVVVARDIAEGASVRCPHLLALHHHASSRLVRREYNTFTTGSSI
jgi:hypothetical protein